MKSIIMYKHENTRESQLKKKDYILATTVGIRSGSASSDPSVVDCCAITKTGQ